MAQRNTVQQKIIAGQLAKLHGSHPTADEVYQSMKDEYPSISRATVYRNLNKMSDNGQALKVRVSSGADLLRRHPAPPLPRGMREMRPRRRRRG